MFYKINYRWRRLAIISLLFCIFFSYTDAITSTSVSTLSPIVEETACLLVTYVS